MSPHSLCARPGRRIVPQRAATLRQSQTRHLQGRRLILFGAVPVRTLLGLRVIDGSDRLQPKANGPLPEPASYDSDRSGPKPDRPTLVTIGTDIEPVPLTGLAENFSPMPRIAPPPFGNETVGGVAVNLSAPGLEDSSALSAPDQLVVRSTIRHLPVRIDG